MKKEKKVYTKDLLHHLRTQNRHDNTPLIYSYVCKIIDAHMFRKYVKIKDTLRKLATQFPNNKLFITLVCIDRGLIK